MSSSSSPKSPEFSDKSKKYDRQLRLWGEHGQSLLETARVCLINVTVVGTEILKGIILPGVGGFTIVDGTTITEEDLGANFFLDHSGIGQSKAKHCSQLLQELNPDVNGDYVDEPIEQLLQNNPEFLNVFDVVIGSRLDEKTINMLSNKLWELNIPFVYCRSVGLIATSRIQLKEHYVVESHPDNKQTDLRLETPFPALKEFLESTEITSKVPWLAVVYSYLRQWQDKNNSQIPKTYKEKQELKQMIQNGMQSNEENYEEAMKAVNSCFGGGTPNSRLNEILTDSNCVYLNRQSKPFWILCHALKEFLEFDGKGCLPISGVIPDMTADTNSYITLQNIYRNQAIHDSDIVYRKVKQLLKDLNLNDDLIAETDVKLFCREAASLALIRGSKLADEYDKNYKAHNVVSSMEAGDNLIEFYIGLRAMEKFQTEYGRMPDEVSMEGDTARLKVICHKMLSDWSVSHPMNDDVLTELCRYGGNEIHTISAFMGGCISHEVIKLITRQYIPVNNTVIYSGITSQTETYSL